MHENGSRTFTEDSNTSGYVRRANEKKIIGASMIATSSTLTAEQRQEGENTQSDSKRRGSIGVFQNDKFLLSRGEIMQNRRQTALLGFSPTLLLAVSV
jgi:hypothetical protein